MKKIRYVIRFRTEKNNLKLNKKTVIIDRIFIGVSLINEIMLKLMTVRIKIKLSEENQI